MTDQGVLSATPAHQLWGGSAIARRPQADVESAPAFPLESIGAALIAAAANRAVACGFERLPTIAVGGGKMLAGLFRWTPQRARVALYFLAAYLALC